MVNRPIKKAQIGAHLAELYPHLFTFPVPLKVGIFNDLRAVPDRQYGNYAIQHFLKRWCTSDAYCQAIEQGKSRYGLDGSMYPMVTTQSRRWKSRL